MENIHLLLQQDLLYIYINHGNMELEKAAQLMTCLLYTSDAADDWLVV